LRKSEFEKVDSNIDVLSFKESSRRLRPAYNGAISFFVKNNMPSLEEQYDEAMYAFSTADYEGAITLLKAVLEQDPSYFDAQLSLGMAYYRKGDYAAAIAEGHKAEKLRPKEQLVHTNLSLYYMKSGDKKTAEHHGLQARIASWRDSTPVGSAPDLNSELTIGQPSAPPMKVPEKFPDMPWKKKPPLPAAKTDQSK
jgi:tetratricopeptide (TPR) repeat protein